MVSSYINNKGPVYDKYSTTPTKTTQSTTASQNKSAGTTVAQVMKNQGATAGEANRFANISGAPSMAQLQNQAGATPGEAQRFANIAASANQTPPPPPPPPTTTPTKTTTPPATPSTLDPTQNNASAVVGASTVYATPAAPPKPPTPPPPPPIKSAPIDTVLFNDELVSEQEMLDLLLQDIGGQELLLISRHDTVNGQRVSYSPIKNLDILQDQYSPDKILRLEGTSESIFNDFVIDLSEKIPLVGNGEAGRNYYIDETDGSLVIEFINLAADEEIEVQVTSSGTIEDIGV